MPAAERLDPAVRNADIVEGFREGLTAELRQASRAGKSPHVHERLDAVRAEDRDEILDGARGVADGPDGSARCHRRNIEQERCLERGNGAAECKPGLEDEAGSEPFLGQLIGFYKLGHLAGSHVALSVDNRGLRHASDFIAPIIVECVLL